MTTYLLSPFSKSYLNNIIFEGPTAALRDLLAERGISLRTVDLGDIRTADKILFYDLDDELLQRCLAAGVTPDRMVLFLFEPEATHPVQYNQSVWRHFGQIFTTRDDLVDSRRLFKIRWPQILRRTSPLPRFEERKLAAMINSNKFSYIDGEGFSYRRKAIEFFDLAGDFDLYGPGWNDPLVTRKQALYALKQLLLSKAAKDGLRPSDLRAACAAITAPGTIVSFLRDVTVGRRQFRSYMGTVPDKDETLSHYRFCLCYENQLNRPGYMTEKIFDSFLTGTIPVYLGATNVDEYIPRDCFIWMKDIPDFAGLYDLMMSMTSDEFYKMQQAGQEFLDSELFTGWTPRVSFADVIDKLLGPIPASTAIPQSLMRETVNCS